MNTRYRKRMIFVMLMVCFYLMVGLTVAYAEKWKEADYVNAGCNGHIEFVLYDKARVDCLTVTHAIEYDYGHKWAEAVGQSLYYSSATGKKPGIVLIVNPKHKGRYIKRLRATINMIPCKPSECPAIKVWVINKKVE